MTDDEWVWIARGSSVSNHYHTDPDCTHIGNAENPDRVKLSEHPNRSLCDRCDDEVDGVSHEFGTSAKLEQMTPEEFDREADV